MSTISIEKCGCGREARYFTSRGLACNKYMRCAEAGTLRQEFVWTDEAKEELRQALEKVFGPPIEIQRK